MEDSDQELLQRFAGTRDQRAFQLLVHRHLGLVHAVARRVTGSEDLAKDVAQSVFIRLAQQAAAVSRQVVFAAWLHRTTRSLAIDLVRGEARRRRREERAFRNPLATMDAAASLEPDWMQIAPVIDDLVNQLPTRDRELLLLRYYESRSHAAIGGLLGLTEQAARMRSVRALEKLRALLARRGITTSSAALSTLLPAYGSGTVSPALTATVLQATQGIAPLVPAGFFSQAASLLSAHRATLGFIAVTLGTAALVMELFPGSLPAQSTVGVSLPPVSASSPRPPAPKRWTAADALEMLQAVDAKRRPAPAALALVDVLSDWSATELQIALQEALRSPDLTLPGRDGNDTVSLLVKAWMQQDLSGFLSWRESLRDPVQRELLAAMATRQWPESKAQEALAYAVAHPDAFPEQGVAWKSRMLELALRSGAKDGPAAVAGCLALAFQSGISLPGNEVALPRGFDFKALVATPEAAALWALRKRPATAENDFPTPEGGLTVLLNPWLRQNRDEAFDVLLARGRELGSLPANYYYPFTSDPPTPEQASWLVGKLQAMTPEERQEIWRGNATRLLRDPATVDRFLAIVEQPEDIRQLHEIAAGAIQSYGVAAALPHLEALGEPAERIAFLESGPLDPSGDILNRVIGHGRENEDQLRQTLTRWQATPRQIDAIVRRINFYP